MAHFAEVDDTNTVIRVAALHDDVVTDEQAGIDFLNDLYPGSETWVQCFKDGSSRHNYPGPGHVWDAANDAFYESQPYPSWSLNGDYRWQAPTPLPVEPVTVNLDGETYDTFVVHRWDEETTSWIREPPE